jgi:methylase of polypeptide subunit release factors
MSIENHLHWQETDAAHSAHWRSETNAPAPKRVLVVDDRLTADAAYRLACEGTALLWRGDFQNARQLLQAMARRVDEKPKRAKKLPDSPTEIFHLYRLAQSQRARILGSLLIPFEANHQIPLRRAPNVQAVCESVYGTANEAYVASLRELQGMIGAFEWRKNGVEVPALGARIHPHYGVFAPIRNEYIGLVAETPLPIALKTHSLAFDIGTGTGVLAALLAQRGIKQVIATDLESRALTCAQDNLTRLGLASQVTVVRADLFPEGQAALVVCNPPWLPGRPSSALDHAIFDLDSQMLRGFLHGLAAHLMPQGEGWLILSDLAEHLGLRSRAELLNWIAEAGLQCVEKRDVRPTHPRVSDKTDPLHEARSAEMTSLWRLMRI